MKRIIGMFVCVLGSCLLAQGIHAQDVKSAVVEDGGSGPYKAIMTTDGGLTTHTLFKPQDLAPFGPGRQLPVLVWGNGACANSPWEHANFLSEIASYGFMVIAIGTMPEEGVQPEGRTESHQLLDALEWITRQAADSQSPYSGKVDVSRVAVAGMSCGGLQALDVAKDERFRTVMICNSGLFKQSNAATAMPGMPMPAKSRLQEIHTPILYLLGGPEDIAYENGMDDVSLINHVPVFVGNLNVGHGGTYRQHHGGAFAQVALAWLQWQLKDDPEAATLFTGTPCGLSQWEGWTTDKKNLP